MIAVNNDAWSVTLAFPRIVSESKAEHKLHEWVRRLAQSMGLQESEVKLSYVPAVSFSRGVLHIHLYVKAPGLNTIDPVKWVNKWWEITGKKIIAKNFKHETKLTRGVIRRRNGEETIVTKIASVKKVLINKEYEFRGGGSCVIRKVGSTYIGRDGKPWVCTCDGIEHYLMKSHSRDLLEAHQWVGCKNL